MLQKTSQRLVILSLFTLYAHVLYSAHIDSAKIIKELSLAIAQYQASNRSSQALSTFLSAHPERLNRHDIHGWTPLVTVAARGDCSLVASLLEKKADVNLKTFHDWAPLHVVGGQPFLIDPENNLNRRYTCKDEKAECMKLLLGAKADIAALDGKQNSPLAHALGRYCSEQVKVLLAAGASMSEDDIRLVIRIRNDEEDDLMRKRGIQDCVEMIKAHHNTSGLVDRIEQEEAAALQALRMGRSQPLKIEQKEDAREE